LCLKIKFVPRCKRYKNNTGGDFLNPKHSVSDGSRRQRFEGFQNMCFPGNENLILG